MNNHNLRYFRQLDNNISNRSRTTCTDFRNIDFSFRYGVPLLGFQPLNPYQSRWKLKGKKECPVDSFYSWIQRCPDQTLETYLCRTLCTYIWEDFVPHLHSPVLFGDNWNSG